MEYQEELTAAKNKKEEIGKLFKRFRKKKPKHLDELFHSAHDRAFEEIDCLKCANCCKTTSPIFRDVDIERIAKKFKQPVAEFEDRYLKVDEDGDWVLKSSPCEFLQEDNTCFIYDVRPQACREYPHTNRKRIIQILDLTFKNTEICPAVAQIVLNINSGEL